MKRLTRKQLVWMVFLGLLCATVSVAGPFVTGAQSVSNEVTQAAAAGVGAVVVFITLTSLGGGLNGRLFLALIEAAIFVFVFMNPNSISQFFRFGG